MLLARSDIQKSQKKALGSCNLSDLVAGEVLVFEPVFYQNRKSITAQIAEDIQIRGNERQICQLLKIMLDNAVKYSPPGKTTEVVLKKSGRQKACLQVISRGGPIPESERKAVFGRCYRGIRREAVDRDMAWDLLLPAKSHIAAGRAWVFVRWKRETAFMCYSV